MYTLEQRCARSLETARQGTTVLLIMEDDLERLRYAAGLLGRNVATLHTTDPLGMFNNDGRTEARVVLCIPGEIQRYIFNKDGRRGKR